VRSALAVRLFASDPGRPTENTQFCPTQVLPCSLDKRLLFLVVEFSGEMNFV
jgi:hypothetical protein